MISMAQLASRRTNTAELLEDFDISHFDDVRSLRTDCKTFLYAPLRVENVRTDGDKSGMTDESTGARLRRLQERSGLSYDQIAKAAGYAGRSSVQRYFSDDFDGPITTSQAKKLALGFQGSNVTADEIWALADLPTPNATPLTMGDERAGRMARDIPVYGTALGAPATFDGVAIEQTHLDQGEVINYFSRPSALSGRKDVYAVYIQGSSMAPRFQEGEVAFVDSKRPPMVGDDVLVFIRSPEDDGERVTACLIKRLVRRSTSYVELEQFGPAATFKVNSERVSHIHRVIPWAELLA
ncbi:S24 family peptidase [Sphingopyxis sp. 22461]|uniref:S24 family peptidase n=1 Tax=Sphingopyxis sp. 22461 TaxID=3453923 RepID=UPI003F83D4F2